MTPFTHEYLTDKTTHDGSASMYLADIPNLKNDATDVGTEFMAGRFGVQRSGQLFYSVWTDMELEQEQSLNRDVKCSRGTHWYNEEGRGL